MTYTLHINYNDSDGEPRGTETYQIGDLLAAMDHYGVPNKGCGKCVDFEDTDESTRMLGWEFDIDPTPPCDLDLTWSYVATPNEEE